MKKYKSPIPIDVLIHGNPRCAYGCGNPARYITGGGKFICSISSNSCPINRNIMSDSLSLAWKNGRMEKARTPKGSMKGWENKSKDDIKNINIKRGKTVSRRYCGSSHFLHGTHLSKSWRQSIARSIKDGSRGVIRCKWYDIFCPYLGKSVKVQGTWELKYAEYLNKNKILWIRGWSKFLKWKLHQNDIERRYHPDFFLPETDEFIEIKGFFFKSKDGRTDDERKMNLVISQNPLAKISILTKTGLKDLGVLK